MSRTRFILLGLMSAVALSAVMATSALAAAPEWWVEGSVIKVAEKIAPKGNLLTPIIIKSSKVTIECTEDTVKNGFIGPGNKNSMESLVMGGCKIPTLPSCVIPTVESNPLVFPLIRLEEKGKIKLNFTPETGKLLAKITVKGECAAKGSYELTVGEKAGMQCEYPGVETEKKEHELNFSEGAGSELLLNGEKAILTGIVHFGLASGKLWSAK